MNVRPPKSPYAYLLIAILAVIGLASLFSVGKASVTERETAVPRGAIRGEVQANVQMGDAEAGDIEANALQSDAIGAAPDIDRIHAQGKLTVAMFFEDVPPFFMHNRDGQFSGIDVEIANDLAKKLGVEVEFNRTPQTFDEVVEAVAKREADVAISLLSDTLNRATQVRFSDSYVELHQTLLINRLELARRFPTAESTDEINLALNQPGIKIGVIDGTSYVDFVREAYPLATYVSYEDFNVMVEDVATGALFALLYDELEISNWKYANPDGGLLLRIVVLDRQKDTIALAVHRDDENLLAWLNLYLAKAKDNGFLDGLFERYLKANEWRNLQ